MKAILREPLLHFLLLGAAVFAAHGLLSRNTRGDPGRIVVTQGQVTSMALAFRGTWQRPPTREELDGLIQDRVREEVYWREAVALGLDKDDTVIRRRLRQKMEFLTDDLAAQAQPTDDELSAYLTAHPEPFRVQRRFTFSHVYLRPDKHGDRLTRDTATLLAQLKRTGGEADVSALGDPFLLDHTFTALPGGEVEKLFGAPFAARLGVLSPGQWEGPVSSGYGVHLVLVRERTDGHVPPLAEVRDAVAREWANTRRLAANQKSYEEMLKRYTVTVEAPPLEAKTVAAIEAR